MLNSLSVRNYALISSLEVEFHRGLSSITGETGAGKSILMGALGLVLGERADLTTLNDKTEKCVVEASFSINGLGLEAFFRNEDLDYDDNCLLRRELLPSSKSRAFINDTPVTLPVLKSLGDKLVDIHAQHHNLMLKEEGFPLEVVDAFLGLHDIRTEYGKTFREFRELNSETARLQERLDEALKEQDYLEFQYNQLNDAKLMAGEEEALEQELEMLSHASEIQNSLGNILKSLSEEEINVLGLLNRSSQELTAINKYFPDLAEPQKRMESAYIELKDISSELEKMLERVDFDPQRLEIVTERLDLINSLLKKHQAGSSEELIKVREDISSSLLDISTSDTELNKLKEKKKRLMTELRERADNLSKERMKGLDSISTAIVENLKEVGMPNASFQIRRESLDNFTESGLDRFTFWFSANKNQPLELVHKVASGGEISRLMLSIKSLISESLEVPTLIFDEIDAGVSGEIADKMGKMLRKISKNRQVLNVTHLPQVAGRSDHHYQVYKLEDENTTRTGIRLLDKEGRIMEMAKMLSGEQLTSEALGNARALLHNS
jgi:DNA repair protein RecN (Recombination protein N)